jgi:hypothetical protein
MYGMSKDRSTHQYVGQVTSLDPRGPLDRSTPTILTLGDATFKARDCDEITLYIRMKGFDIGQIAVTRYNQSGHEMQFLSDESLYVVIPHHMRII